MRTSNDIDSVCLSGPATTLDKEEITHYVEERTSELSLDSSPGRRTRAAATDTHHCPKVTP